MREMVFNRRRVKVYDTGIEALTDWGYAYTLYADSTITEKATYYTEISDASDELVLIAEDSTLEEAKVLFDEHMKMLAEE